METQKALRQPALAHQVLDILSARISSGVYAPGSLLPPEMTLAGELEVSRATIRRAMDLLVERGLVHRRQGVGTYVARLPDISNPLNQFIDFREMMRLQGFTPGLVELSAALVEPGFDVCKTLELDPRSQVVEAHKYFTANDDMVVYCINHIPAWVFEGLISPDEIIHPGVMEPILDFYEKRCGKKISFYTCTVRADIVRNCGLPFLSQQFKPDTPVLVVDEVGHGEDNRPLHHSVEYHPGNRMQFGLIRLMGAASSYSQADALRRAFEKLNGHVSAAHPE
jgi:GntR family transcriptional regulator